ncbi:MAG: hypothetical protein CVV25_07600 [Ignavibacteriae bacterium HGW-Ignavibacteriae-4]|nr:MAG: hypothetical protein CVV25_07600 [Ignavibacteriae bacterium HGW-Ignavibacteriae-4]
MKKTTTLLILLFLASSSLWGQKRQLHIPSNKDGNPKSSYSFNTEFSKRIALSSIPKSDNLYHCRLWIYRQIIEVWVKPTKVVSGLITSWTQEYDQIKEERTENYFYKSYELDSNKSVQILKLIDSLKINGIPDIHFSGRFRSIADGTDYIIETANETEYNYRTYWTPAITDTTQESVIISNFIEEASRLANASENWDKFTKVIPYKCYTNGGVIACVYTEEEYRKMQNENNH